MRPTLSAGGAEAGALGSVSTKQAMLRQHGAGLAPKFVPQRPQTAPSVDPPAGGGAASSAGAGGAQFRRQLFEPTNKNSTPHSAAGAAAGGGGGGNFVPFGGAAGNSVSPLTQSNLREQMPPVYFSTPVGALNDNDGPPAMSPSPQSRELFAGSRPSSLYLQQQQQNHQQNQQQTLNQNYPSSRLEDSLLLSSPDRHNVHSPTTSFQHHYQEQKMASDAAMAAAAARAGGGGASGGIRRNVAGGHYPLATERPPLATGPSTPLTGAPASAYPNSPSTAAFTAVPGGGASTPHGSSLSPRTRNALRRAADPRMRARLGLQQSDALEEDPIFRLWMRQHPDADTLTVAARKHRRMREIADAERTERQHNLSQLQHDLAHLQSLDELGEGAAAQLESLVPGISPSSKQRTPQQQHLRDDVSASSATQAAQQHQQQQGPGDASTTAASPKQRSVGDAIHEAEAEAQRLAWMSFTGTMIDDPAGAAIVRQAVSQVLSGVVSAKPEQGELARRGWRDQNGEWHSSTHKHENAATCIQCAFRCSVARTRATALRRMRVRTVRAVMQAESALEYAWVAATSVKDNAAALASEVDETIRVMSNFSERLRAVVTRRRRRMQRDREMVEETMIFAATRIQAWMRGYLVRRRVELLRHPEIADAKRAAVENTAATNIARIIRGHISRKVTKRRSAAATLLQSAYRRHLCEFRASQVRRAKRVVADAELTDYAAFIIQRFMRSLVVRRRRGLREFRAQTIMLQAVGRAYRVRRALSADFELLVNEAAVDIQRMFRGWYARSVHVTTLVEAHRRAMEEALQHHAAGIVTRAFRRAQILSEQRTELLQNVAATEIQRMYRGLSARRNYKNAVRDEQMALDAQLREDAVVVLQSAARGFLQRRRYLLATKQKLPAAWSKKMLERQEQRKSSRPSSAGSTAATSSGGVAGGGAASSAPDAGVGATTTSGTDDSDEPYIPTTPDTPATNAAASRLQLRFYRPVIRHRSLRAFVMRAGCRVLNFMRALRGRRLLGEGKARRADLAAAAQSAAEAEEQDRAARSIQRLLVRNKLRSQARRSERVLARRREVEERAAEAERQELECRVVMIQRCVRGYMIRRFFVVVMQVQRANRRRQSVAAEYRALLEAENQEVRGGVTSYEAACALQKYYVKHRDDGTEEAAAGGGADAGGEVNLEEEEL